MKSLELVGERFGKLCVMSRLDNKLGHTFWKCLCDCGRTTEVRGDSLKQKKTTSCGCVAITKSKIQLAEIRSKILDTKDHPSYKHGMSKTATYKIYRDMLNRCYNKNKKEYEHYGGRGIIVCQSWRDNFLNFLQDMGIRPNNKFSLERLDGNGNYEKTNVVWISKEKQLRNRKKLKSNNSGKTGVCFCKHTQSWMAIWSDYKTFKQKSKRFYVKKLGFLPAQAKASIYRDLMITLMNEQGAGYSEKHGE